MDEKLTNPVKEEEKVSVGKLIATPILSGIVTLIVKYMFDEYTLFPYLPWWVWAIVAILGTGTVYRVLTEDDKK